MRNGPICRSPIRDITEHRALRGPCISDRHMFETKVVRKLTCPADRFSEVDVVSMDEHERGPSIACAYCYGERVEEAFASAFDHGSDSDVPSWILTNLEAPEGR